MVGIESENQFQFKMKPVTKKTLIGVGLVALILFLMSSVKAFGTIVNRKQNIRGCDPKGCGTFGAIRDGHVHQGIDIIAETGEDIISPIDGVITRFPFPYGDDLRYTGIEIKNEKYKVTLFYVTPFVAANKRVKQGEKIGTAQNLHIKYGSQITNHVHIEVRLLNGTLINPSTLY